MRRVIESSDNHRLEVWESLPEQSAEAMNKRFRRVEMGSPIDPDARSGQVQSLVMTVDGNQDVVGAAYAHLWEELEALLHMDDETPSGRVHILSTVWVDEDIRYRGYSREMVKDVKKTARRLGAEHLVAKVAATDSITQRWLQKLGFTIFVQDTNLVVGGVTVPAERAHVFAWVPLKKETSVSVTARL
jgi:GNAT superfamily N-acetyltransferase